MVRFLLLLFLYTFLASSQKHKKFSLYQPCKSSFPREIQHLETPRVFNPGKTTPASSPHIKRDSPVLLAWILRHNIKNSNY